ncbi:DUF1853 family protein [Neisseria perflava]|uniref:DUF1853 family protein n=1 Tax=Neisseria perflava TaxID=33053 RepID=UPI00209F45D7|nr:DUF1853 family protein [Neisseria perflava]MCP1660701.1 hypothetical protein [Neisseria perflava]MCP1773070.1 hypothetical protein [Neisseria perflava]
MNYSLDAIWWKLTAPAVRDLAALLTAPPLWHSGCELPVRELLGEGGFRYLLALDQDPQPLQDYLTQHAPFGRRLGLYAEHLLAFWFARAPHAELLAHNLPVVSDGLTLGAADFIVRLNDTAYHIELTCKYYGCASGQSDDLCGLNRQDRLRDKAAKLPQQLMLLKFSDGQAALQAHGLPSELRSASIVRGIAFSPNSAHTFQAPVNPYAWRGSYLENWAEHDFSDGRRYYLLDRMTYLAPARVTESETQSAAEIRQTDSGLIAVLQQRPDGFWHEVERIMKRQAG